jgi:hypothetical protein
METELSLNEDENSLILMDRSRSSLRVLTAAFSHRVRLVRQEDIISKFPSYNPIPFIHHPS